MVHERFRNLLLRIPLAIVFLWFGVDKFPNTSYWVMWVPEPFRVALEGALQAGIFPALIYAIGVFEVFVGVSLILGFFVRYIAAIAFAFLLTIIVASGPNPATIRDMGLLGPALYLAVAPGERPRPASPRRMLKTAFAVVAFVALITGGAFTSSAGPILPNPSSLTPNPPSTSPGVATPGNAGPPIVFLSPAEGEVLSRRTVEVRLKVLDLKKLGLSHIHIKLDGRVIDAIYLPGAGEVVRQYQVEPGRHTLTAFLAYIDHSEVPGYNASITFTVRG